MVLRGRLRGRVGRRRNLFQKSPSIAGGAFFRPGKEIILILLRKLLTKVDVRYINGDSLAHEKELNAWTIKLDILMTAP